jgi:hypothetical protein
MTQATLFVDTILMVERRRLDLSSRVVAHQTVLPADHIMRNLWSLSDN